MIMFESCLEKQAHVKAMFEAISSPEERYQKLIELGRALPPLATVDKTAENLVQGCQSTMYLKSTLSNGLITFEAEADALISSGLAALLVAVYSEETPETVLKCPPSYLDELGIGSSLTPNRANGLYNIHLRMKQDALKLYMSSNRE